jgi:hypothetical protein
MINSSAITASRNSIIKSFDSGFITLDECTARLRNMGYTKNAIPYILKRESDRYNEMASAFERNLV